MKEYVNNHLDVFKTTMCILNLIVKEQHKKSNQ